ncbi:MAG: dihydroorotate oxidase [Microgenomates group bacterium Gr01-1014_7]|nr:MAG: dihydroorotate oxidase [Microgenomates group bacterium Gr01-1014_7]
MLQTPFYDPGKTYDENYNYGPYGAFADGKDLRTNEIPKIDFLGFKINTPFGIPAGPLLNAKFCKAAFEKGFDVIHYKTRRSRVFPTNQWPNVLFVDVPGDLTPLGGAKKPLLGSKTTNKNPTHFSITNSFGNPSPDPDIWQEDMKKAVEAEGPGQLLVASVVGTIKKGFSEEDYFDDFAKSAKLAKETGVKVIELNLSCPNVANEGIICYDLEAVERICRKSKGSVGDMPLLIKLGYFSPEEQNLLENIVKSILPYISGIAAINTIPAPVVDENGKQALPGSPARLVAGICGASIKWAGLEMVKRLNLIKKKLKSNFAIIGVGGVMKPADYFEYRKFGSDLVQSATGAMWNPYLAQEVKRRLKTL